MTARVIVAAVLICAALLPTFCFAAELPETPEPSEGEITEEVTTNADVLDWLQAITFVAAIAVLYLVLHTSLSVRSERF